jgi:hypothetical protein
VRGRICALAQQKSRGRVFILTDWKIVCKQPASGEGVVCIFGRVFGNPRFKSGRLIHTSALKGYRRDVEWLVVTTRNGSEYGLGNADPAEPFAVQRLLRRLDEAGNKNLPSDETDPSDSAPDTVPTE